MRSEDGQWSTGDDYDSGDVWLRGWASTVVSLRIRRNDRCPRQSSIIFPIGSVSWRRANQITSSWLFLYIFGHKIQQKTKVAGRGCDLLKNCWPPTSLLCWFCYLFTWWLGWATNVMTECECNTTQYPWTTTGLGDKDQQTDRLNDWTDWCVKAPGLRQFLVRNTRKIE